jgi:hypothetical protein
MGRTHRLRIALDLKYPGLIASAVELLEQIFVENDVALVRSSKGLCVAASVYSSHLPCLFPQHGAGPKHRRLLRLEPWQWDLVEAAPVALLRGLINSDGSVFVNRTDGGRYEYLSYHFCSMSSDIALIWEQACELAGIEYRMTCDPRGRWNGRINRRESVAKLIEAIPPKT